MSLASPGQGSASRIPVVHLDGEGVDRVEGLLQAAVGSVGGFGVGVHDDLDRDGQLEPRGFGVDGVDEGVSVLLVSLLPRGAQLLESAVHLVLEGLEHVVGEPGLDLAEFVVQREVLPLVGDAVAAVLDGAGDVPVQDDGLGAVLEQVFVVVADGAAQELAEVVGFPGAGAADGAGRRCRRWRRRRPGLQRGSRRSRAACPSGSRSRAAVVSAAIAAFRAPRRCSSTSSRSSGLLSWVWSDGLFWSASTACSSRRYLGVSGVGLG